MLTISLPLPPAAVKPNARVHWARKAKATKAYRAQACYAARLAAPVPPRWAKARMEARAYFKTARFPDPGNFMASLKAAEDGLQDAGIIRDDKGLWPERPQFFKDAAHPRVEITITEEA